MKFSSRLYLAFGLATVLTVALGVFSMLQVSRLTSHLHEIGSNWMPSVQVLGALKSEFREFRTQELQHILSADAKMMDDYEGRMSKTLELIDRHLATYGKLVTSSVEGEGLAELKRLHTARVESHMKLRAFSRAQKNDEAIELARGEIAKQRAAIASTLDKLIDINERAAENEVQMGNRAASFSSVAIPVSIVLAALIATVLAVMIVRITMRQLGADPADTKAAVDRIAAGDLATPIELRSGDTTSLLASLAAMRGNLTRIVESIKLGSEEIRTASAEVSRGNLDLSSRTEQQSSSLQETASALEQITGTIRTTSDNASSANELARSASETAERGGQVVESVVRTMNEIADSSQRVKDIIGVIDGIAFQTNILALNAAVEAARAGEQGRGFAVVASEVRTLAQRSADAAKEIKSLIETSTTKVTEGTTLVADAGTTMGEVVQSVRRVAGIIGEITSAAHEQSTGVGQINEAVSQLDSVTQQNAALVEEAAAATKSMEEQADRLVEAVSVFRVNSSGHPVTATVRAPVRAAASAGGAVTKKSLRPALPRKASASVATAETASADAKAGHEDSWQTF